LQKDDYKNLDNRSDICQGVTPETQNAQSAEPRVRACCHDDDGITGIVPAVPHLSALPEALATATEYVHELGLVRGGEQ
jgi:hypothetical protein